MLRESSFDIEVHEAEDAPGPEAFDGVIVGDSIHAVHHSRSLVHYLRKYRSALEGMPTALFQ
jgi:menaquinone-dependent protoporphyrinogen IX oxidase